MAIKCSSDSYHLIYSTIIQVTGMNKDLVSIVISYLPPKYGSLTAVFRNDFLAFRTLSYFNSIDGCRAQFVSRSFKVLVSANEVSNQIKKNDQKDGIIKLGTAPYNTVADKKVDQIIYLDSDHRTNHVFLDDEHSYSEGSFCGEYQPNTPPG